jgi:hypothetical protein
MQGHELRVMAEVSQALRQNPHVDSVIPPVVQGTERFVEITPTQEGLGQGISSAEGRGGRGPRGGRGRGRSGRGEVANKRRRLTTVSKK